MNDFVKTEGGILVPASSGLLMAGKWEFEHIRGGEVIDRWEQKNLIVNEGLNDVLSVYLNGGTQKTTWYLGLFEGNYTPVATDTAANIAANSTETSAYTSGTRPEWVEAAPSSQSITNSASRASFVFNATKTIYGGFLISNSTKGGTSGVLLSAARFSASKAVVNLDELLITYTLTASSV